MKLRDEANLGKSDSLPSPQLGFAPFTLQFFYFFFIKRSLPIVLQELLEDGR